MSGECGNNDANNLFSPSFVGTATVGFWDRRRKHGNGGPRFRGNNGNNGNEERKKKRGILTDFDGF
jgi:hypothetical protein